MTNGGHALIVPVKHLSLAKCRLHADETVRRIFAMAFLRDVLDAVALCDRVRDVLVVTSDDDVLRESAERGFGSVAEPGPRGGGSLRLAIDLGLQALTARRSQGPVVVLPSDLPCLTPEALGSALRAAAQHRNAFVPDHLGTGTTLLASQSVAGMTHHFGPDSARLHRAAGAVELASVSDRLRLDVDDRHDLREAWRLGVGSNTLRLKDELSRLPTTAVPAHPPALQAR